MSLLGQWPPVITGQTFEILDTLHRENFMQYRVRFYWTPNEQTEGLFAGSGQRRQKACRYHYLL